jgi:membrane protein implicated in regulation of membrane protease activity
MTSPLLRYALLQLPGIALAGLALYALHRWWRLAAWEAWLLLALWIAKDALLYLPLRRALSAGEGRLGAAALVGAEAVVEQELAPRGRVRVRGELWQAQAPDGDAIAAGTRVRVRAVRGLTLEVARNGDSRTGGQRT